MHIFLLDDNVSVSRVTELQKYLNDVVVRSWQNMHVFRLGRDSFLLEKKKKKDRKWIDNHSFKTSTFSYWTRMCHVSHSLKYTFTMLLSGVDKVRWSSVKQKRSIFCHPWPQTSFCWNKMTVHWISLCLCATYARVTTACLDWLTAWP